MTVEGLTTTSSTVPLQNGRTKNHIISPNKESRYMKYEVKKLKDQPKPESVETLAAIADDLHHLVTEKNANETTISQYDSLLEMIFHVLNMKSRNLKSK